MAFDHSSHITQLNKRVQAYVKSIEKTFGKHTSLMVAEAFKYYKGGSIRMYKDIFFSDPNLRKAITAIAEKMTEEITVKIMSYEKTEWLESYKKNTELIKDALKATHRKFPKKVLENVVDRNLEGLIRFQKRRINGLNLSDRVWNVVKSFEKEVGIALNVSLVEGRSAAETAREVKKLLKNPDALFRKVKNKYGNLGLSQAAKKYHPGRGVYRSAYKNALRMVSTEINMAYRQADMDAWQEMDFVRGIEIKRSKNLSECPMCDKLKGIYPKNFVFIGWHPNCRCYATSILISEKDMQKYTESLLAGKDTSEIMKKNQINEMPKQMKEYLKTNSKKIQNSENPPYWIKNNMTILKEYIK